MFSVSFIPVPCLYPCILDVVLCRLFSSAKNLDNGTLFRPPQRSRAGSERARTAQVSSGGQIERSSDAERARATNFERPSEAEQARANNFERRGEAKRARAAALEALEAAKGPPEFSIGGAPTLQFSIGRLGDQRFCVQIPWLSAHAPIP